MTAIVVRTDDYTHTPMYCNIPILSHHMLVLSKQPQGCVIIFLTNFLALLIKVDAAGEDSRSALGGLLVAVNVLLALAVIFTSWFALQQSVDDARIDGNALSVARVMLTADRGASQTIRSTGERSATVSSAPCLATHDNLPIAPSRTRWGAGSSRLNERGSTRGATIREDVVTRKGRGNAAMT